MSTRKWLLSTFVCLPLLHASAAWADEPARGLGLGAFFGSASGNFTVGAQVTSPWFADALRVNVAAGPAFYPDALNADMSASWQPFGLGHARLEAGPDFFRGAPIRPYSFGGVVFALLPRALSDQRVAVGGMGGIGVEVAHFPPERGTGNITYGFELAGVGSSATATTPAGDENFLSGLMVNASIRGYLW